MKKICEYTFGTKSFLSQGKWEGKLIPDVQRIVDENPEADFIFVESENVLLLLKKEFLNLFEYADNLLLAGERLYRNTGYSSFGTNVYRVNSKNYTCEFDFRSGDHPLPKGWVCVHFKKESLQGVLSTLARAKKHAKKCTFKVTTY